MERGSGPAVHDRGVGVNEVLGVGGAHHFQRAGQQGRLRLEQARVGTGRAGMPAAQRISDRIAVRELDRAGKSGVDERRGAPEQHELLRPDHLLGGQVGDGSVHHRRAGRPGPPRRAGRLQGEAQQSFSLSRDRRRCRGRRGCRGGRGRRSARGVASCLCPWSRQSAWWWPDEVEVLEDVEGEEVDDIEVLVELEVVDVVVPEPANPWP